MSQRIDIENIGWITTVGNSLRMIYNDLNDVNTILSSLDDFLQQSGKASEFHFSYKNQRSVLQRLEEDVTAYQESLNYFSIADFVDAEIDNPFYLSLEQAVKKLSLAQLDRYSTKSVGGTGLPMRQGNEGLPYSQTSVPNKVTIEDVLSTQHSQNMLKFVYEAFLKILFPWTDTLENINYSMFYKEFLRIILGIADFDYKTGKDKVEDFLLHGIFVIGMIAMGGTVIGGLFGKQILGFKYLSMASNGSAMFLNLGKLLRGTDANGNRLTEKELEALAGTVVIQAAAFGISTYTTINTAKGADTVKPEDIKYSDKFNKGRYKTQVAERGWTNESIADTISNPIKILDSVNSYNGNPVKVYFLNDAHYVAVDTVTGKVIQVSNLNILNWKFTPGNFSQ